MDYQALAVVAVFAFLYSLISSRLERTIVSGALVYVIVGFLCGQYGFGLIHIELEGESLKVFAELTLALVLFVDSANTNLVTLRRVESIPLRLLLIDPFLLGCSTTRTIVNAALASHQTSEIGFWDTRSRNWLFRPFLSPANQRFLAVRLGSKSLPAKRKDF